MPVEIDEAILKDIASMTEGKYFRATDNNSLAQVYSEIDKLEKSKISVKQYNKKEERYMSFGIVAFALFLIEMIARSSLLKNLI
jgi:Ca-activated chloride channel family protein